MGFVGRKPTNAPLVSSDLGTGIVGSTNIADNAVLTGKIADGTITLDDLSATGTKNATTFLRGDNTFASAGGANTPAFEVHGSGSAQSISDNVFQKITILDTEIFDTDTAFASDKFTVPAGKGGKYFFFAQIRVDNTGGAIRHSTTAIYVNGSVSILENYDDQFETNNRYQTIVSVSGILNLSAADEVELYNRTSFNSGTSSVSATKQTIFGGYKIIE